MGFRGSVESALRQYATFRGRAPRAEYWWFYLFSVLVGIAANILDGVLGTNLLNPLASLALLLPSLAVGVRRLHDSNLSGWWLLAPIVCGIVALVLIFAGVGAVIVDAAGGGNNRLTGAAVALLLVGLLMGLVSLVVGLVLMLRSSTPGPNRFGPDPYGPNPYGQGGNPPYGGPGAPYGDQYGQYGQNSGQYGQNSGQPAPYQGYGNPYGGGSPDYGDRSGPR
ncbi:DUF805 domain-containing protein [Nocardioides panaciterrulae]|uniref:Uncharacterized membrane protein YhaH (DUF805 family) n=1 Tax=Nocardioides panaciterrulae TaxID=661492 RepID=A0A7Y9E5K8_9ACTN|nr:DUF805 domain-containing protein [Nocardioides panaciterrulae]NYD41673.1 uncharacterized membrane protein YhaH (DUF805 family) [Nocardioides panaciterrulae]